MRQGCPSVYHPVVEEQSPNIPPLLVELGRFSRLKEARDRGLVLAASGVTHSIGREGEIWTLRCSQEDISRAVFELAAYEAELMTAEPPEDDFPSVKVRWWSLPLVAMLMVGFAVAQAELGEKWSAAGIMSSDLVCGQGQWWRTITALTLHGDVPHVLANLGSGIWFGGLLVPSYGQGLTWLAVIASGALGNVLTAWAYYPGLHRSLGASSAVFGALGLLVGDALVRLLQRRSGRTWWRWVLPLGAGIGLLAFLGAGEGKANVDVLAHLWGFAVGIVLGFLIGCFRPLPAGVFLQWSCGISAGALVGMAWFLAL